MAFEWTLTLGNIVAALLVAGVFAFTQYRIFSRIDHIEHRIRYIEEFAAKYLERIADETDR